MKKKMQRFKEWAKENKDELKVGGILAGAVGICVGVVVLKYELSKEEIVDSLTVVGSVDYYKNLGMRVFVGGNIDKVTAEGNWLVFMGTEQTTSTTGDELISITMDTVASDINNSDYFEL